MTNLKLLRFTCCFCLVAFQAALAGSATWQLNPVNSDWNTAANWTPPTVPNGATDIATFDVSNQTTINLSADIDVNSIVFNAGANSYHATVPTGLTLTIENGITNNSGMAQNFVLDHGSLVFNGGNAGQLTTFLLNGIGSTISFNSGNAQFGTYTIEGGGQILFNNFTSAGFGNTLTLEGNGDGAPGLIQFSDNASSFDAIINLNGSGAGSNCVFLGQSHTFAGTFNVNGADSASHNPGVLTFAENSDGGSAIMIANAGINGGAGGKIIYRDSAFSSGFVQVYGNGSLDISGDTLGVNLSSLEGDGSVFLGNKMLTCSNEINAVFSGKIQDGGINGGTRGAFTKRDRGILTLSNANTYTGGTVVTAINPNRKGTLQVTNTTGSATGTGPVAVNLGTLGGSGIIRGAVTVGVGGNGTVGFLAPAAGGRGALTLTIQSALTFRADSAYNCLIQSRGQRGRTDRLNANGVTIESGAQFTLLADQLQSTLRQGAVFTVISNTAVPSINGVFANLADGTVLTVNGNNLQANYEGGDGNDLTLTVVP
jgi:autotransporter-associated beta strand protein